MDKLNLKIIQRLQYGFPVCEYPYAQVAQELSLTEIELIERLDQMLFDKVLTRFGPMYHAEALGGALSLVAMSVPKEDFKRVSKIVNGFDEVAHNYERNHRLNMWFVVATEVPEQLDAVLTQIEQQSGYAVYNMPKLEEFFVGLYLDLYPLDPPPEHCVSSSRSEKNVVSAATMSAIDRQLILQTQEGLPLAPRPYHVLSLVLNISADEVMARLEKMLANGVIRRIAAVPNHYKLGYRSNGMTVWDVSDEQIRELGKRVGKLPFVSHCYHRPRHLPHWRYNLFAMVHGKTKAEVEIYIEHIRKLLGDALQAQDVLYSTRILKKTGLRLDANRSAA
jgi:DNA-binding Lrp family transcriptional regulator